MNCLATLANMAPHCHQLSAYAAERLVSLFDMLSKKYFHLYLLSFSFPWPFLWGNYSFDLTLNEKCLFFPRHLNFPFYNGSRYNKLAEQRDKKTHVDRVSLVGEDGLVQDMVLCCWFLRSLTVLFPQIAV